MAGARVLDENMLNCLSWFVHGPGDDASPNSDSLGLVLGLAISEHISSPDNAT
jgi:hypothetical protein